VHLKDPFFADRTRSVWVETKQPLGPLVYTFGGSVYTAQHSTDQATRGGGRNKATNYNKNVQRLENTTIFTSILRLTLKKNSLEFF
jgi:hypothetical protein